MKTDASLTDAIIRRIVQGADPVYSEVYIYGEPDNMTAVLEKLEEDYGAAHPCRRVVRITGEEYMERVCQVLLKGKLVNLMFPLEEECGLFIFRDIEKLGGKESYMELIYGVLDHCLEHHIQLVVTGSVPVKELDCLEDRIRAQLAGCLCCSLEQVG